MISAIKMRQQYREDPSLAIRGLEEALQAGREGKPGGVRPDDFSLRDLAAAFVTLDGEPIGHRMLEAWAAGRLIESGAVSSSAFAAITNRIVYAAVMEGYAVPDTPLSNLVRTIQARSRDTRLLNFTLPLTEGRSLEYGEAQDKPLVGLMSEYVRALPPVKRGARLPITRESVVFDETAMILEAARQVGTRLRLEKEQALTKFVCGLISNCVIERRRTDSSEAVADLFYTSGGRWTNQHVNPLADWTDLDDCENLLLKNTLPGTDLPPMLMDRVILLPPQLASTANRILNATEVRYSTQSAAAVTASANPLANRGIRPLVSPFVYSELKAAGVADATAAATWFFGDLLQAFRYLEVWPLEVVESRDDVGLRRSDIVVEFHASEFGVPVAVEPRVWAKNVPS